MVDEILVLHGEVNDLYIPRQVSVYNQLIEAYQERHIELVASRSDRIPFVLGDVPAVPVSGIRVGIHNGVGAVTAQEIRMPLSPRVAAVLRREPADHRHMSAADTQLWNWDTWRRAIRFLVAPIDVDWRRATALAPAGG